jgi:hypothetical protein
LAGSLLFYEEPLLPVPHINAIGNRVLQKKKTNENVLVSVLKIRLNSGPVSGNPNWNW